MLIRAGQRRVEKVASVRPRSRVIGGRWGNEGIRQVVGDHRAGKSPFTILSAPSASLIWMMFGLIKAKTSLHPNEPHWAGVSTSIHFVGEPVAVASSGPTLSHSG